ncbi:MAG: phosphoglucosamine mutase [Actinomycetota bacterium]
MGTDDRDRPRLFGTDGVRGEANVELTPELAMRLGWAAVEVLASENPRPLLLLGKDTRISGDMLEAALVAGICSAGGEVEMLGVIPTPAVAHLARSREADAGVVISASHNPAQDNGIKFFHRDGYKLPDRMEREIEDLVYGGTPRPKPRGDQVGCSRPAEGAEEDYLEHLLSVARPDLQGVKVVVDCANGASYRVAPELLRRLGARVTTLNAEPDGLNINRECGSTHCGELQRAVVEEGALLGLAFDGDADRLIAVDERGEMVDGDHIMAICAVRMKEKGLLRENAVVATVMSNLGFHRAMEREGIKVHQTAVGDRYVLERMLKGGFNLGGEQSGHVIFLDHATTGDGLVTALKVLEAMRDTGEKLSSLSGVMVKVPQLLVNVRVRDKEAWRESEALLSALREWEERLGDRGRVLLRPSGTEPVLRVMVEALDGELAERAARELAALVEREMG